MSDNVPDVPTVELLLKELKDVVDDWKLFGVALGVPLRKLNTIKLDDPHGGVENWKLKMFQFWLHYKPGALWKDVIQALKENDYNDLAATLSRKYPFQTEGSTEAEIRATTTVVQRLKDLEIAFAEMLTDLPDLLTECECDLSKAQSFLDHLFDTKKFSHCSTFDDLLHQLRQDHHIDTFNINDLQTLVARLTKKMKEEEKKKLMKPIKDYEMEREEFLNDTLVTEFLHAVFFTIKPAELSQKTKLTIKISNDKASKRTLKDIEKLALKVFDECCRSLVCMHAEVGSVIISWFFPDDRSDKFEALAKENTTIFIDAGVEEVTVGGRVVFPCTLEEDTPPASLKEIYTDFYHRLVEAVSDEHTCQSLLTQLNSPALIEEKIAQLTSSKVTGSSFLKTLGLEEEPHLLVPLVSAMSGVEQLQTLAEKMTAVLQQGVSIAQDAGKLEDTERQQLLADIVRLTSDKEDLLTRLRYSEEDLRRATELSIMSDKTRSGMLADASRRDTIVKESEDIIRLKSISDITVQTTTEAELVPLPADWEARSTTNGHVFYVDHNTQTTQWQDPRTIEQYQLPSLDLPTLPAYKESSDQHSWTEPAGEPSSLQLTSEDVIHAYDVTLRASKKREQELQEQLNVAQRDSQEKDQKCSKLEDAMYGMLKKMAVSRDDYEQQQELLVKLQQKSVQGKLAVDESTQVDLLTVDVTLHEYKTKLTASEEEQQELLRVLEQTKRMGCARDLQISMLESDGQLMLEKFDQLKRRNRQLLEAIKPRSVATAAVQVNYLAVAPGAEHAGSAV